jgi:hypothetical protein
MTEYKITWFGKAYHSAVGEYEVGPYINYAQAPDARTMRKWFMKGDIVARVVRVQNMDAAYERRARGYERSRA